MELEQVQEFKDRAKKWLVINRVPESTKEEFIEFANKEFCGDYGMLLRELWSQYKEYQFMKSQLYGNAELKLNHIIDLLENKNTNQEEGIKLLSGKTIKKEDTK